MVSVGLTRSTLNGRTLESNDGRFAHTTQDDHRHLRNDPVRGPFHGHFDQSGASTTAKPSNRQRWVSTDMKCPNSPVMRKAMAQLSNASAFVKKNDDQGRSSYSLGLENNYTHRFVIEPPHQRRQATVDNQHALEMSICAKGGTWNGFWPSTSCAGRSVPLPPRRRGRPEGRPFHQTWPLRSTRPQPVNVLAVPRDVFHNESPGLRDVLDEVEGAAAGGKSFEKKRVRPTRFHPCPSRGRERPTA